MAHGTLALAAYAVRLAKRYVQERALPDRAIDLLDEAAARKRVEIDGLPADMDDAIRRVASLKAQIAGLQDDTDAMSVKTRERLEKEIRELEPSVAEMRTKLESRRGALAAQAALKEEMAKLMVELEQARKEQSFARLGSARRANAEMDQDRRDRGRRIACDAARGLFCARGHVGNVISSSRGQPSCRRRRLRRTT